MTLELFNQGPGVYVPVLLVSILITAISYSLFPIILAKTRRKGISARKYSVLCYVFNFLVMVFFIALNGNSSGAPYILWTSIFCHSGLKALKRRNVLTASNVSVPVQPSAVSSNTTLEYTEKSQQRVIMPSTPIDSGKTKQRYCKLCGGAIEQTTKRCTKCGKQYFRLKIDVAVLFLAVTLILSIAICIMGIFRISQYKQQISHMSNRISELETTVESRNKTISQYEQQIADKNKRSSELIQEKNKLEQKVNFYDRHIVFVLDDNTNRYHKYDCTVFRFSTESFWAYNTEAAKSRGYTACFACD